MSVHGRSGTYRRMVVAGVALAAIGQLAAAQSQSGACAASSMTIAGFVTDTLGWPIANARVISDEVPETRSDTAGRFTVRDVPRARVR